MAMNDQLPFELAQEFGIVALAEEGGAIAVATAPHMTVATLSAARQRLGKPLRARAVDAEQFRALLTSAYSSVSSGSKSVPSNPSNAAQSAPDRQQTDLLATATGDESSPAVRIVNELLREALAGVRATTAWSGTVRLTPRRTGCPAYPASTSTSCNT